MKGDTLEIELKHGGLSSIESIDFASLFSKKVLKMFSKKVQVVFVGQTEETEIVAPNEPETVEKTQKAELPKKEIKAEPIALSVDGLPEFLYDAQLFYGRKLDNNFIRMIDIVPPVEGKKAIC